MRLWIASATLAVAATAAAVAGGPQAYPSDQAWGEALFFDTDLSLNRTQSCASCHDPNTAFTDPREADGVGKAVSLGDDGTSVGTRNAPTAMYAGFAPPFEVDPKGIWRGGLFLDGRAVDLAAQAGMPPVNPSEMEMPDSAAVVARLRENPRYVATLQAELGDRAIDDDAAYAAMTQAIAAYEKTPLFAPFSSKYDRSLRGEVKLTDQEELGRLLFFSKQFTSCNLCHQLRTSQAAPDETFTNYEYHNIGVPANPALDQPADTGLAQHPVEDPAARGRFKVPTLRNVAVTGPYMHNGVFRDLETVVRFYNHYNSRSPEAQINPETGKPWGPPEVDGTLSMKELETGPALDDKRIKALVAFLKTLTDEQYEDQIPK